MYYPIFLDITGKPVILVGGGRVALEKLGRLVEAGADVTIVAPQLADGVREFVQAGRAGWIARGFEPGDTAGAYLVMVATDDGAVNRKVADEARANGALVNAADDAGNSDFILPAVARKGRLTLAASTGGSSPAMARWLRTRMPDWLTDDVVALADLAAELRLRAREREVECAARCPRTLPPPPLCCAQCPNRVPAGLWQDALGEATIDLLRNGDTNGARGRMVAVLGLDEPLTQVPWWTDHAIPEALP